MNQDKLARPSKSGTGIIVAIRGGVVSVRFPKAPVPHGKGIREPVVSPLLPLAPSLLRNHIFASVFHASAEAMVTENAARLELMQQAEQAADERLDEVNGQLRTIRQDEITNELMDIIIGFEALKKKPPALAAEAENQRGRT